MTDLRQAAQQALEALERINAIHYLQDLYEALDWEIDALRAALAEPEQEPVSLNDGRLTQYPDGSIGVGTPTTRKPLTDGEMRECAQAMNAEPLAEGWPELIKFARAIENKHGIGEQT